VNAVDAGPSNNGRGFEPWGWTHLHLKRLSPSYCRVTFDHPPINAITATSVIELAELVGLIDQDRELNVVVFDSANPDFFLAHYDTELDDEVTRIAPKLERFDHDTIARTKSHVDRVLDALPEA
jgi:enoyl-CoA hydratase/carnithine racemase